MMVKYNKRMGSGLVVQASYKLSKWLTDGDATGGGSFGDHYNRHLLKSIAGNDQTHIVQFTYAYALPVGKGKLLFRNGGVAGAILGGWRISGIQSYASGTPMSMGGQASFSVLGEYSNMPTITTYDGWRAPIKGSKFDPNVDLYLNSAPFPAQGYASFGNMTRYNPKMRYWPSFNENENVSRTFNLKEKAHLEFRFEGFNVLNRVAFGPNGGTTIAGSNFGKWNSQSNTQRRMQLVAKLTF